MTSANVRLLGSNEVEIFRRIRLEALRAEPAAFASSAEEWEALSEVEWRRRLTETPVFVALCGDDPVGMMGLRRQPRAKTAHRASIVMVYVRESLRGRGVSKQLLAELTSYARRQGIRQLELAVNAENLTALHFYHRQGFVEVGRLPGGSLVGGREIDEITMTLRIDG